ncbi:SDR family oxidoreductase [Companilactobacillus allii]|uniref:NAD-dependent dehydratase n=1 Tax=Companilactobacillus allii TaxID=1847728 RepID=A0A1P8Q328_9LACO|nr:SDR family oxidoreductase [Companilactobacillus allii]APX72226.1 NAD-dependent dehydratase [Companilactobacillus allii]USQ69319.1 SDR family oxidoreductase [Companilactobacillus allii]
MTKVLIVGAHGQTARIVTDRLLNETDDQLVLFLRNSSRLNQYETNDRVELVDGDILDTDSLAKTMDGVDIVYSNVGGPNLADQATSLLNAMKQAGKKRLIFISSLGAYHEVPGKFGEWNEQAIADYLPGFRKSAQLIEASNTDYTMIRPAWMSNKDEINYETTQKTEPFKGTEVSRKSIADFVIKLLNDPTKHIGESVGLNKPNTDGDKPEWI